MNVNYYLKDSKKDNSAITAIVRFRGERFKLAPGVSVKTEFWDPKNKRVLSKKQRQQYTDAGRLNILLDRFESDVKKLFEPHILNRTRPSLSELKTALNNKAAAPTTPPAKYFTDYYKQYYETADYKRQTWKKYNTTYNWLLKYEKHTGNRLSFADIDLAFYEQFKFWVLNKKYIRKKGEAPRHYSLNYFGSIIKCIKRVMQVSGPDSRQKLHANRDYTHEDFKTPSETADTIYLSVSELLKIHHFTATPDNVTALTDDPRYENRSRKAAALNLSKNKFLIGCFTALRVSDFNRLLEVNVNSGFISIRPAKGIAKNEPVVIPIHSVIAEILKTGFDMAQHVSDQKLNKHIKEVAQLVDINDPVVVSRTEGNKVIERTFKKYELVCTHTARRSGATNMFLAGVPSISIMKITNHRTESSFMKYLKISQTENARLLADHPFFKS